MERENMEWNKFNEQSISNSSRKYPLKMMQRCDKQASRVTTPLQPMIHEQYI